MSAPDTTPLSRARHQVGWVHWAIAVALGIATVVVLMSTNDMGFTRDESFYFHAARDYQGWFVELQENWRQGRWLASFEKASVDRHFSWNPEHPVVMKALFGISDEWLHRRWGWLSPSDAMRFPAIVWSGWLVMGVFLFAYEVTGRKLGGLLAVLLLMLMPRFFFHSHLTCFDVPITAAWFWVIYAYWKSLDNTGWAWAAGLLWGLALATKLNAFFLPVVLLVHWGLGGVRQFGWSRGLLTVPRVPLALFTMAALGPLLHHLLWPRHWFETWPRLRWYFQFHLRHEHYFIEYFGQNLWRPPFPVDFPFAMTAVTVPVVILAIVLLGLGWAAWDGVRRQGPRDRWATGVLLGATSLFPILLIAQPETPVFGGVKHWFPAMPFLCIYGAVGLTRLIERAGTTPLLRAAAACVALTVTVAPALAALRYNHPYGTAYYNELIGGYTGAADQRMQRLFWGYESRGALAWLNENAPRGARVYPHNTTGGAWAMYREEGMLRSDLQLTWSIEASDFVLYHHKKAFWEIQSLTWDAYGTYAPAFTVQRHGVPFLSVYDRRVSTRSSLFDPPALERSDRDESP